MEFDQIKELIALIKESNIAEFSYEQGDLSFRIRSSEYKKQSAAPTAPAPQYLYAPQGYTQAAPPAIAQPAPEQTQAEKKEAAVAKEEAGTAAPKEEKLPTNLVEIRSPMVGTFYRSSSPEKAPFVKVGDEVGPETTVCMVEAMKLFNEIKAEMSGRIVKVLCDDSSAVEYDQPLFLVEPLV